MKRLMLSAIAVSMVAFHVHAETLEDAAPEDVKPIVLEEIKLNQRRCQEGRGRLVTAGPRQPGRPAPVVCQGSTRFGLHLRSRV